MMRDYGKIAPQYWTGETGKRIRKEGTLAQLVGCYLLTCPSSTMLGVYYLPLPTLCHEVGCPLEGALKALKSLSEAGFAHYDEATEHVWVPNMAKYQIGEELKPNDNRLSWIRKEVQKLKSTPFFDQFLARYREAYRLHGLGEGEAPSEALRSPLGGPAKPGAGAESEAGIGEGGENRAASPAPVSAVSDPALDELASIVAAVWNSIPGVKLVSDPIPSGIRKKLFARLREHPDPEWWRAYIDRIGRSSFLCGRVRDWSATFDWVLGPKNMEKILLGNYDDKSGVAGAKPPRMGCQFVPNVHIGPGRPKPCGQPVASQPGKAKALPFCSEHLGPEEAWRRKQEEELCGGCDGREKVVAESTLGNA